MNRPALALAGALFFVSAAAATAQAAKNESAAQSSIPQISSNAQQVVLDMVFRDKHGKPIQNIQENDVRVYEDGKLEHLDSFQYIQNGVNPPESPVPQVGSVPYDPMRQLRLVTLVFQNLSTDGRRFFRQALKDVLDQAPEQNLYFSIMTIDPNLELIQPFTNNHAELLKAYDRAATWSFVQNSKATAAFENDLRQTLSQGQPTLSAGTQSGPSASSVQALVNYRMAQMQYEMLQSAGAADRESDARFTIDALLNIVRAEGQLPGRKVVLYFNPSLFIPEVAKEEYHYMIGQADRSNVAFYTVDPAGLSTMNESAAQGGAFNGQVGESGQGQSQLSDTMGAMQQEQGTGGVSQSMAQVDENAENAIRSNPLLWLQDLAHETGGVAITNTNDLNAPMRTVMDEVRSYYEASYNPHIKVFDGKFRKITVRVDKPGVIAITRTGYYALPTLKSGQELAQWELPLMNALSAATPPSDLAFRAAAERFNQRDQKIRYMITVDAPMKGLTFKPLPDKKGDMVDAAIMAVVRNPAGDIVEKFSKNFVAQVPEKDVDRAQMGDLVQSFPTSLLPGSYSLDAVVMDRNDNKIGVTRNAFTVPQPTNKLAISSVVVVLKADKLKNNQIVNPFYFNGGKIEPTLTDTLKGGPGHFLPLYFTVYPDPTVKTAPVLTMSFYKDGQYLGAAPAPLPPAENGRIPDYLALPADQFTPGSYEIKVGVQQGASTAEEDVSFKVD